MTIKIFHVTLAGVTFTSSLFLAEAAAAKPGDPLLDGNEPIGSLRPKPLDASLVEQGIAIEAILPQLEKSSQQSVVVNEAALYGISRQSPVPLMMARQGLESSEIGTWHSVISEQVLLPKVDAELDLGIIHARQNAQTEVALPVLVESSPPEWDIVQAMPSNVIEAEASASTVAAKPLSSLSQVRPPVELAQSVPNHDQVEISLISMGNTVSEVADSEALTGTVTRGSDLLSAIGAERELEVPLSLPTVVAEALPVSEVDADQAFPVTQAENIFVSRTDGDIRQQLSINVETIDAERELEVPLSLQNVVAEGVSGHEVEADQALEVAQVEGTFAQRTDEDIRQQLLIDVDDNILLDRPQPIPSSSFLTPSAYGADWGDAFISLSGATEGNRSDLDGSLSLGLGLGNAIETVGLEVAVGIISLDGFADDGIVGFKLHKVFPQANNLGIAAGWSNPVKWGAAETEEDTFYGVVTQRFDLRSGQSNALPLTASVGVGTGTFRSNGAIAAGDNSPNIFGSLGLRVIPEVSVVTSWTGNSLGVAASAAPLSVPLVVTAGVSDVTDNTVEGARFQGSLGYSFSF